MQKLLTQIDNTREKNAIINTRIRGKGRELGAWENRERWRKKRMIILRGEACIKKKKRADSF